MIALVTPEERIELVRVILSCRNRRYYKEDGEEILFLRQYPCKDSWAYELAALDDGKRVRVAASKNGSIAYSGRLARGNPLMLLDTGCAELAADTRHNRRLATYALTALAERPHGPGAVLVYADTLPLSRPIDGMTFRVRSNRQTNNFTDAKTGIVDISSVRVTYCCTGGTYRVTVERYDDGQIRRVLIRVQPDYNKRKLGELLRCLK